MIDIRLKEVRCDPEQISGAVSSHGEPQRITTSLLYASEGTDRPSWWEGRMKLKNLKVTSDVLTK